MILSGTRLLSGRFLLGAFHKRQAFFQILDALAVIGFFTTESDARDVVPWKLVFFNCDGPAGKAAGYRDFPIFC